MPRFQRLFGRRLSLGGLRHRFAIEAPVDTADEAGGATRAWEVVDTVWAAVEPFGAEART